MEKPTSLHGLLEYLKVHRKVTISGHSMAGDEMTVFEFRTADAQGIMFGARTGELCYLPVNCRRSESAAKSEAGVVFDDAGFEVTKFGMTIRIDYVEAKPDEVHDP